MCIEQRDDVAGEGEDELPIPRIRLTRHLHNHRGKVKGELLQHLHGVAEDQRGLGLGGVHGEDLGDIHVALGFRLLG